MAEQDDGRWEDRFLVVNHNEVVALVLPHQIRNGLHLQIHVAAKGSTQTILMTAVMVGTRPDDEDGTRRSYLKKAMRRLTIRMYWTKR